MVMFRQVVWKICAEKFLRYYRLLRLRMRWLFVWRAREAWCIAMDWLPPSCDELISDGGAQDMLARLLPTRYVTVVRTIMRMRKITVR